MSKFRFAHLGLVAALLGLNAGPALLGASTAYAAENLRPEVGKPLQAATDDIKKGKYKDALAKVHEAEAVGGRSAYENYMIDYMRASAAQGAGENDVAAKSYESVINTSYVTGATRTKMIQVLADIYYRSGEYPKAVVWLKRYISDGGDDPATRQLLVSALYSSGNYPEATKEVNAQIQADEKAGRAPSEVALQTLANCALKQNDKAGYVVAIEKLATYHPKKELWVDLLNRLQNKQGFSEAHLGLDVLRMRFAIGGITTASDYMNMAELDIQAGYPTEAKAVIDNAFKTGVFGAGAEAARQKRLQDLASKKVDDDQKTLPQREADASKAKDGNDLVSVGYDYVTMGQFDKGIGLIEEGISKGDLKYADGAKLHLGMAYLQAGKKAKGQQILKMVQGTDGASELAHYWSILSSHPIQ
jgi:tetratricopeptide (TPR) repeat protein